MPTLLIQRESADSPEVSCQFPPGTFDPTDEDAFFEFCQENDELKIERTANGEIEIMSPTGWESGNANAAITARLFNWALEDGRGRVADSNAGYLLGNGSERAPDSSWILKEKIDALPREKRKKFLPLVPDFVIELRSSSDRLAKLQEKMAEYAGVGVELGWLIDPFEQKLHVYSKDGAVQIYDDAKEARGVGCVEGFVLDLEEIFGLTG